VAEADESLFDVPPDDGAGSRQGLTGDRVATPRPPRRAASLGAATERKRAMPRERVSPSADDLEESVDLPVRPEGSFEDATTAAGQLEGESIEERTRREQPDRNAPGDTVDASDGYLERETT
jgi:hypothetical protein